MPDLVLGAGHPVVNMKNACLLGADTMVNSIDVHYQINRLQKPEGRAFGMEKSGQPRQAKTMGAVEQTGGGN